MDFYNGIPVNPFILWLISFGLYSLNACDRRCVKWLITAIKVTAESEVSLNCYALEITRVEARLVERRGYPGYWNRVRVVPSKSGRSRPGSPKRVLAASTRDSLQQSYYYARSVYCLRDHRHYR